MAKTRVGINGFGRIGRNFLRAQLQHGGDFEVVAANDIGDTKTMAHLLKHDSVLGNLDVPVEAGDDSITVDGHEIKFVSERDPANLPWADLGVEVAIESTGLFTKRPDAEKHLQAGAARAIGLVLPDLKGKVDGMSMRAPVPIGSIVDLVVQIGAEPTAEEVNELFRSHADTGDLEGILQYTDEPIVSSDIVHSSYSSIFDSDLTMANGNLVKVFSWYDNEWGYSCRLVDLVAKIGQTLPAAVAA